MKQKHNKHEIKWCTKTAIKNPTGTTVTKMKEKKLNKFESISEAMLAIDETLFEIWMDY